MEYGATRESAADYCEGMSAMLQLQKARMMEDSVA
jgi:hypothetical protein